MVADPDVCVDPSVLADPPVVLVIPGVSEDRSVLFHPGMLWLTAELRV